MYILPASAQGLIYSAAFFNRTSLDELVADCPGVRSRAYSAFSLDIFLDHVGKLGNSNPMNVSQWLRIMNRTAESGDEVSMNNCGSYFILINFPSHPNVIYALVYPQHWTLPFSTLILEILHSPNQFYLEYN
jgi:hypothetical protein